MKRSTFIRQGTALAALSALSPLGMAGSARAEEEDAFAKDLYAKAKAAGEKQINYYSSIVVAQYKAIAPVWKKLYPDIELQLVRADLGLVYDRVLAEKRGGRVMADVISNDDVSFLGMRDAGILAPFDIPSRKDWVEPFKSQFNGYQFPSRVLQIGIAVNTAKVKMEDAPKTWKDLTDKRWKGRIGLGDPRVGGGAQLWFVTLMDHPQFGEKYLTALQENDPLIKPGVIAMEQAVELGEVDLNIIAYDYVALPARDAGKPVAFVMPADGRITFATNDSLSKTAPHPNAARLFINFMMGVDAQEALAKSYVTPVNGKAKPNPKGVTGANVPVLATRLTEAQVKNMRSYVSAMNRIFQLR